MSGKKRMTGLELSDPIVDHASGSTSFDPTQFEFSGDLGTPSSVSPSSSPGLKFQHDAKSSRRSSVNPFAKQEQFVNFHELFDKATLTPICKELRKVTLQGALSDTKKEEIYDQMYKRLSAGIREKLQTKRRTNSDPVEIPPDGADTAQALPFDDFTVAPRKWKVLFFQNEYFVKVFYKGKDADGKPLWDTKTEERLGMEYDIANAKCVLQTVLCGVTDEWGEIMQENKSAREVFQKLEEVVKSWRYQQYEGLILFFSSHGSEGHIQCYDGQQLAIRDVCTALNKISEPKLIFVQACQGTNFNAGVEPVRRMTAPKPETPVLNKMESDAIAESLMEPMDHNFLVYYSSTPENISVRYSKTGSVFLMYLFYRIIMAHCDIEIEDLRYPGVDLYNILTRVNHDMSRYTSDNGKKQMPVFINTLTKRVKLVTQKDKQNVPKLLKDAQAMIECFSTDFR